MYKARMSVATTPTVPTNTASNMLQATPTANTLITTSGMYIDVGDS